MHLPRCAVPIAAMCAVLFLASCGKKEASAPPAQASPAVVAVPVAPAPAAASDALMGWVGQWDGPEGTYLRLAAKPDSKYDVTIKNLDGARTFPGTGDAHHVYFERDGKQETITATDGAATGMKWLADKSTCLTVKAGEGYCR